MRYSFVYHHLCINPLLATEHYLKRFSVSQDLWKAKKYFVPSVYLKHFSLYGLYGTAVACILEGCDLGLRKKRCSNHLIFFIHKSQASNTNKLEKKNDDITAHFSGQRISKCVRGSLSAILNDI